MDKAATCLCLTLYNSTIQHRIQKGVYATIEICTKISSCLNDNTINFSLFLRAHFIHTASGDAYQNAVSICIFFAFRITVFFKYIYIYIFFLSGYTVYCCNKCYISNMNSSNYLFFPM
jgi:hypothetical protein